MAPRANWKGFLRLSLVTCPVALFPATSESEKVSFKQINKNTGHRIKYAKVDAETGDEVACEDIIKGYKVDTDTYVTVDKDELDHIALKSTRTIDIDEFVPKSEIDELYLVRPYYIMPEGKVGHDAFAVIRETIRTMDKVAIARVVLTNREHIIALEARGKGLIGMLLRYPYEIPERSPRRCSISQGISSKRNPPISSRTSSRTGTKTRWLNVESEAQGRARPHRRQAARHRERH
jgi:DNA end-binding protein Ku